ncbi:hypothetical protein DESA109040_13055 [Deinococcus saxicola]|uniref:hypothetical protein n=1 Tax=Deinococcus saxicola TaxID=249406 RepID=UPI0039F0C546
MKRLALAFLVAAAATSCNREVGFTPTPISFVDHPGVLRGPWSGDTSTEQRLRLQLTPAPETAKLTLQRTGKADLELTSFDIGGDEAGASWFWQGFLPDNTKSFNLTRETS